MQGFCGVIFRLISQNQLNSSLNSDSVVHMMVPLVSISKCTYK